MDFVSILRGILGFAVLILITYLFSNNKKAINWKLVAKGLGIQLILAIFTLKGDELSRFFAPLGYLKSLFTFVSGFFVLVLNFTTEGSKFIFGNLALGPGTEGSLGMFFAFQVLPIIIFFASLMSVLYYLGVMQRIVQGMAWIMQKLLGTSGAESLSNTANIFIGQTEAPLMIKPFIKDMTKSELLTIMVGGMATIAGSVMAAYIQILGQSYSTTHDIPLAQAQLIFANHLLVASVMAAFASLIISKILIPETEEPVTKGTVKIKVEKNSSNVIEAAAQGASEGLTLALNVAAMLIAFIAIIALLNYSLTAFGNVIGVNAYLIAQFGQPLSLQLFFGLILQYLAFLIGVPWDASFQFGSLLGTKVVLNEFVAYLDMGTQIQNNVLIDKKAIFMATYALCGFANFSSIAIQIGGLSPLAPERRSEFAQLGLKAVLGGTLATLLTATLAGAFFS